MAAARPFSKGPLWRGENHHNNHRERVYLLGIDVLDDFTNFCRLFFRNSDFMSTFVKSEVFLKIYNVNAVIVDFRRRFHS